MRVALGVGDMWEMMTGCNTSQPCLLQRVHGERETTDLGQVDIEEHIESVPCNTAE